MVLKTKLPETTIDHLKLLTNCSISSPWPTRTLANRPLWFREQYALLRFYDEKMNAYLQALIKQHDSRGYAQDEDEVTDDEEEN
jgi:hypothetical protein